MLRKYLFHFYWILLLYIIVALTWWFVFLLQQNDTIYNLQQGQSLSFVDSKKIDEKKTSSIHQRYRIVRSQVYGEYAVFLFVFLIGAWALYRLLKKEFYIHQQEQHFLMGMTHELKTPIAIALLNIETLQNQNCDKALTQNLLNTTKEELKRLNGLYENMMTTILLEEKTKHVYVERFNVSEALQSLLEKYRQRYPTAIIQSDMQTLLFVNADATMLSLCFRNLLDNAFQYSGDKKNILVVTKREQQAIEIRFVDEGFGIEKEEREFIFEKFYRSKNELSRNTKGSGLGLFLVKQIVSLHGGKISYAANQPQGSVFTLTLPIAKHKKFDV